MANPSELYRLFLEKPEQRYLILRELYPKARNWGEAKDKGKRLARIGTMVKERYGEIADNLRHYSKSADDTTLNGLFTRVVAQDAELLADVLNGTKPYSALQVASAAPPPISSAIEKPEPAAPQVALSDEEFERLLLVLFARCAIYFATKNRYSVNAAIGDIALQCGCTIEVAGLFADRVQLECKKRAISIVRTAEKGGDIPF